jgi:NMD protein affecting ribosome stability and mRNA decay
MRLASEDEGLLLAAISEALGISVAEVMDCYYQEDSEASMQDHVVGEAISKCQMVEEGKRWFQRDGHRVAIS